MKTDITWLDAKHIPSLESMKESGERALQSLLKSEKLAEIKAFLASNSVKPLHRVSLILAFLPVVAVLFYVVYQLYFHPLAKYPGPFWLKLSNVPTAYHSWLGDTHLHMWWCHQEYGPIVRYGPNRVLFNTVTALKEVYSLNANVHKSPAYGRMVHRAPSTVTVINKRDHGQRRRLLGPGFTESAVKAFNPQLQSHVGILCDLIKDQTADKGKGGKWGSPMQLSDWCSYLTFDLMTSYIFGVQYNLLDNPEHRPIIEDIEASSIRTGVLIYAPLLYLGRLDKRLFKREIQGRNRLIRFIDGLVRKRENLDPMYKDLFSHLTVTKDAESGRSLSQNEIRAESTSLSIAGYDTTSTALTALMFYLSRYPHAYTKLAQEIRSTFPDADSIAPGKQLKDCRYLRACIDEAMRLSPSIGSCLFREVEKGGQVVDGHLVPEGCEVGTAIYSIHHHAEYYPQPESFVPERWLAEEGYSTPAQIETAHAAFNPFSIGPRGCIGKPLAYAELTYTMAKVLYSFDFRVAEGEQGQIGAGDRCWKDQVGRTNPLEYQLYDHVTSAKYGPVLQFRER